MPKQRLKTLTHKQGLYVKYVLEGSCKNEAARKAGYKSIKIVGKLNKCENVNDAIAKAKDQLIRRCAYKKEDAINDLIALKDIAISTYNVLAAKQCIDSLCKVLDFYPAEKKQLDINPVTLITQQAECTEKEVAEIVGEEITTKDKG